MSIENAQGQTVASATAEDVPKAAIDLLSSIDDIDLARATRNFDELGNDVSGYYLDKNVDSGEIVIVNFSDENVTFEGAVRHVFTTRMSDGEIYTITLTLSGDNSASASFKVKKPVDNVDN